MDNKPGAFQELVKSLGLIGAIGMFAGMSVIVTGLITLFGLVIYAGFQGGFGSGIASIIFIVIIMMMLAGNANLKGGGWG